MLTAAVTAAFAVPKDVPDTGDLKVVDRNFGRRPMSDEDQRYTVKLMSKFGLDYEVCLLLSTKACVLISTFVQSSPFVRCFQAFGIFFFVESVYLRCVSSIAMLAICSKYKSVMYLTSCRRFPLWRSSTGDTPAFT